MEYPVKFIPYVAVQLGAHQPFFRGEHIMIFRVTGAGGVEKPVFSLAHGKSIHPRAKKYNARGIAAGTELFLTGFPDGVILLI
jgi:hypothetical protein